MIRLATIVGVTLAAGCSKSSLDVPPEMVVMSNVSLSGAVTGKITALVSVVYNRRSTKMQTAVSIQSVTNPGLGIDTFSVDALLSGMPRATHYSEMIGQITAGVIMIDSRIYQSTVNSQNRIDITGVSDPAIQDDGSSIYKLQGSAAGSAASTEIASSIDFVVTF